MDKVTIYDVAKEADVGIGTVSRVLNNSQRVSDKTKKKVLKVIKKLNYQPNAMARGLALQKIGSIGILVPEITSHFFIEVLKGVQQGLEEQDMDLVLYNVNLGDSYNIIHKEKYINKILSEKRVDGVLAITMKMTGEEIERFRNLKIPLVLVNDFYENISSIFVDDFAGAKKATDYLIGLNHQRIAFINGCLGSRQGRDRMKGFKTALTEAGIEICDGLIKIGDFNKESGYNLMKEILDLPRKDHPTAIFAASDIQAIGALEAINEAGYSVPEEFSLVGYDNIELAKYLKLSTIAQPMAEMGKLGIELLVDSIQNNQEGIIQKELEPELVIRESS